MQERIPLIRKSLYEFGAYDSDQLAQLWDFYVSRPLIESVKEPRKLSDFGLSRLYPQYLALIAGINPVCMELLRCSSITSRLKNLGLSNNKGRLKDAFSDSMLRICCLQGFTVDDCGCVKARENDSEGRCIVRHVRNSLAHGNTFDVAGNLLLVDLEGGKNGTITSIIVIRPETLIDWVRYIDLEARFYFKDVPRDDIKALLRKANSKDKRLRNEREIK